MGSSRDHDLTAGFALDWLQPRYRIVRDNYLGFEAQKWVWWWPFWSQMGFTNTHASVEDARRYILGNVVEYVVPSSAKQAAVKVPGMNSILKDPQ